MTKSSDIERLRAQANAGAGVFGVDCDLARAVANEIEQLRGNLSLAEEGLANYALEVQRLKAAIRLILPLAKGYSPPGQSDSARKTCRSWIEAAENVLGNETPSDEPGATPFDCAAILGAPRERRISMSFQTQEQYEAALVFLDMADAPEKSPPALPHCASCLCHLGYCQNHPGAIFHPPATCPECASGAPAYALLEVVPAVKSSVIDCVNCPHPDACEAAGGCEKHV